jgi:hypothetical protein
MTRSFTALFVGLSALALAAVPTSASASAVTLFSNLGGGSPSYDITQANTVGDDFSGSCAGGADCWVGQGVSFVASATANLSDIQIALSYAFDGFVPSSNVQVSLRSNSSGPGAVLESFNILPAALGLLGNNNPLLSLTSVANPLLTLGTTYWVTVNSLSALDIVGWNLNNIGNANPTATSLNGGATWLAPSNDTPGALRVNGTTADVNPAVPEPTTLVLLGGGVLAAMRKRRAGVRG